MASLDSLRIRIIGCTLIFALIMIQIILPTSSVRATDQNESQPDLRLYPVLYSRDNAAIDSASLTQIIMVGDTSLARGVAKVTDQQGRDYPFAEVGAWLRAADLAVGNYEGVIANVGEGRERHSGYVLTTTPDAAPALVRAGFDILNLANNHTMDWGPDGLKATLDHLHEVRIETLGAGPDGPTARTPVVTTIHGFRIVWLAFTTVPDPPDWNSDTEKGWSRAWLTPALGNAKMIAQIQAARSLGDILIVQFHWGNEYARCPKDWQITMGRAAITAGASLVVGHHPHVAQPFERYGNGFIAYSLGNFLFDQPRHPGIALWIRLDKSGVVDVHGLTLTPGTQPVWNPPAQAASELQALCPLDKPRVP
ncbi:MAG: CapA family protein [Chloroflexota bacterium]